MCKVFYDSKACDTIIVCLLMRHVWGDFDKVDIAWVIQVRDGCRLGREGCDCFFYHFLQVRMIAKSLKPGGIVKYGEEVKDILDAACHSKRWLKVKESYMLRGGKRDENDKDENAAWKIWSDAKAEWEELEELDKMSVEADDGKPISPHGIPPTGHHIIGFGRTGYIDKDILST